MRLPLVIEPEQLAEQLHASELIIIDLSSREQYNLAHIPGAVHIDPSRLLNGQAPVPNKLPSDEQLSALFSECGITPDHWVVVYDDQYGPWAGRFIWSLHCVGLYKASFLNGHLAGWQAAGFSTEQTPHQATASNISVTRTGEHIVDADFIIDHLASPNVSIWDARSQAEYRGEKVINAQKGGHIPGAHWLEWTDTLASLQPARLASPEAIRQKALQAGIATETTVVTHCQTHRRSGLTYIAARYAGFNDIRCYDGSWFEWGNLPNTPVES